MFVSNSFPAFSRRKEVIWTLTDIKLGPAAISGIYLHAMFLVEAEGLAEDADVVGVLVDHDHADYTPICQWYYQPFFAAVPASHDKALALNSWNSMRVSHYLTIL